MTFRSTAVRTAGRDHVIDGGLTIRGVTRPIEPRLEVLGFVPETQFGDTGVGFSAAGEIDRRDVGLEWNAPADGGGVVVANKMQLALEIEAIRRTHA